MTRIPAERLPRGVCPPHAWEDVSDKYGVAYLLECRVCGDRFPDD